jgi:hypothetical protein
MDLGLVPVVGVGANAPCPTDACRAMLARLPSCYSQEFDACSDAIAAAERGGDKNPQLSPLCDSYWQLRKENLKAVEQAVEAMPYCPEPSRARAGANVLLIIGLALGAFGLGLALRR